MSCSAASSGSRVDAFGSRLQAESQAGQDLAGAVMQLAGNALPLAFLGGDNALVELAAQGLSLLLLLRRAWHSPRPC
jgi:UDP-N-acetyl-D-mannosaminuronic acid transferase (WecB/TagA/CpsF family)